MRNSDKRILKEFAQEIRAEFPDATIRAFGSRACGRASPESDLDICVVLDKLTRKNWNRISEIAWKIGFEHDVVISSIKFRRKAFEKCPGRASPLIATILRDGIAA